MPRSKEIEPWFPEGVKIRFPNPMNRSPKRVHNTSGTVKETILEVVNHRGFFLPSIILVFSCGTSPAAAIPIATCRSRCCSPSIPSIFFWAISAKYPMSRRECHCLQRSVDASSWWPNKRNKKLELWKGTAAPGDLVVKSCSLLIKEGSLAHFLAFAVDRVRFSSRC